MEDADFIEQKDGDPTAFSFSDLRAKAAEERFNVFPGDVGTRGVRKDRLKCSLVGALHAAIVPELSTESS